MQSVRASREEGCNFRGREETFVTGETGGVDVPWRRVDLPRIPGCRSWRAPTTENRGRSPGEVKAEWDGRWSVSLRKHGYRYPLKAATTVKAARWRHARCWNDPVVRSTVPVLVPWSLLSSSVEKRGEAGRVVAAPLGWQVDRDGITQALTWLASRRRQPSTLPRQPPPITRVFGHPTRPGDATYTVDPSLERLIRCDAHVLLPATRSTD